MTSRGHNSVAHGERIFQLFRRLITDNKIAGSGVSLSTVRRILDRHGGYASVDGTLDVGSTFRLHFPHISSHAPRRRYLVVDDEVAELSRWQEQISLYGDIYVVSSAVLLLLSYAEGSVPDSEYTADLISDPRWPTSDTELILEASEEAQALLRAAAHDLLAPVRTVSGFVGLVQNTEVLSDRGQIYMDRVMASTERMTGLLQGLMRYVSLGHVQLDAQATELSDIFRTIVDDLDQAVQESQANIKYVSTEPLWVRGEPTWLRQIFQNLIANAIKYRTTERAPEISLSWVAESSYWRISVADNGIGFDQALADKIFEPFKRLVGMDTYAGSGLGLATVKLLVEKHEGRIEVTSTPGVGSTFVVWLPQVTRNH